MKYALLLLLAVAAVLPAGVSSASEPVSQQNLQILDKMPEPVGGMTAIMQQVTYPKAALKDGIEGKVLLSIVVDKAGKVKSVEISQGVRSDLDQAAVKAIKKTHWIPAQKDGKPVESSVVLPIQFKLEKKAEK